MTSVFIRDIQCGDTGGGRKLLCEDKAETGVGNHKAKNAWSHEEPKEARKAPPLELPEAAWPCQHLDSRLEASKTMRE